MKYSKGDKVRIRNIDWYEEMLSIPSKLVWQNKLTEDFIGIWCGSHVFRKEMQEFCGMVMTIQEVGIDFYLMEEDKMGYEFTDEMIAGEDVSWMYDGKLVAERFSDDKEVPKFKKDDRVETHDGLFGYIEDIEYDDVRNCYQYYVSFIVDGGYYYEDQLKFHERGSADSKLPKFKVGDMICRVGGLSNGCLVSSVSDEYYGLQMGEGNVGVLPIADQDEWVLLSAGDKKIEGLVDKELNKEIERFQNLYDDIIETQRIKSVELITGKVFICPEGYIFKDENDNVINATKIVLEKKKKEYPKTYEECCKVLDIDAYDLVLSIDYRSNKMKHNDWKRLGKLNDLNQILICRDAYWKIAGEEMGLGKPWEPTMETVYCISRNNNVMKCSYRGGKSNILEFPTEEIRDIFYENFKDLIEECKELL